MQIILLVVIIILSVILYRMLSTRRMTFPFIRVSRKLRNDHEKEFTIAEAEDGIITIDEDTVIVEGLEYSLKPKKGATPEAYLNIENGRLISIAILLDEEERIFFIDPERNQIDLDYSASLPGVHAQQNFIFSV